MRRILAILCTLVSVAFASPVLAQTAPNYEPSATAGLDKTAQGYGYNFDQSSPITVITMILNGMTGLLGVILVVLMVYAGILYLTAQGEAARVEKAKTIITSAVIGTVIVVVAYALTNFVVNVLFFSQENPEQYQQFKQDQISTICTSAEACSSDSLCYGTPECEQIRQSAADASAAAAADELPCAQNPGSTACWEEINDIQLEQCREDPELPVCCAIFDPTGPLYAVYCTD